MLTYENLTNEELIRLLPLDPDCTPLAALLLSRLTDALDEVDTLESEVRKLNAPLTVND